MKPLQFYYRRFWNRSDAEHKQVAIRLAIVTTAMVYFHSDYFYNQAANTHFAWLAKWAVSISFTITIGLFIALMVNPGISVVRRVTGMVHDVIAISIAMMLGESGAAAVAAIYLWVTLGNGFRYGTRYLYACAALSFVGFSIVFYFSEYWRSQATLSFNILILLAVVPPYVAGLLNALQSAKAQLKNQASFDGLTGLLRRAEFEQHVGAILDFEQAGHCLLFCDLDHFKQVNDDAGHAAGDQLLIDVSKIIKNCVRGDDLVARLGGDEFCVFIKTCPLVKAREIAEKIRNAVAGYRLAWGTEYYCVGFSIGVAPSAAVHDMESLFRLADAACYAAKNGGRNQIHVIDPELNMADTQVIRRLFIEPENPADGATHKKTDDRREIKNG